ncbi:major facilitator superfamily MFS_1 [Dinoroseobacter shibae DFL 12 = DSM 16493]|uniref:Major facilitator superfamily MFS_1 n=1 Tax=Dinoroseobacter shibae (strain DSM 16493 / NCIMB 14021 / DFL 12) TaxID=398580 RepID=A8LIE3_DINSH|nr:MULTISPECIES: organoarsenical effux MFS transporter ArsJ [Dinoroseobacter]ABV92997.1 major facilitator superfamily MFS_1 [Dinoroseobacter shibae DFL 12 = DSM 16493]MDD9716098.1 organoarsenical effux MFS transporter ArsJ [Dinoroseobacter sp. PD6]
MKRPVPDGLRAYLAVTAAYWAFMLTDGALRMLVLLHFHTLGFSALQLAYLFLLYEFMGMVTNLSAGWIAARFGLASTLYAGLAIQIAALVALAQLDPGWSVAASVAFVMAVQGASGVAKDLSKMSAKSAVKVLAPAGDGALFRWVAALTGSKNAVKGLGFLLGAALLAMVGFVPAVWVMAGMLGLVTLLLALFMPPGLPQGGRGAKLRDVLSTDPRVNWLSAARMFLFGARDVWFVVGIPIYFYSVLSDGSVAGNRAAFFQIGGFMALWIIGYGAVQGFAPKILRARQKTDAEIIRLARVWVGILALIPAALAGLVVLAGGAAPWLTASLVLGLLVFGVVFALNSALHSYLILAFTRTERVTMDVGFYYMSNAAGRLIGTLLSGLSFQLGGLPLCLATAAVMAGLSWRAAARLGRLPPRSLA